MLEPVLDPLPLLLPLWVDASPAPEIVVLFAPPQLATSPIAASAPRDAAHFK